MLLVDLIAVGHLPEGRVEIIGAPHTAQHGMEEDAAVGGGVDVKLKQVLEIHRRAYLRALVHGVFIKQSLKAALSAAVASFLSFSARRRRLAEGEFKFTAFKAVKPR